MLMLARNHSLQRNKRGKKQKSISRGLCLRRSYSSGGQDKTSMAIFRILKRKKIISMGEEWKNPQFHWGCIFKNKCNLDFKIVFLLSHQVL